MSTIVLSCKLSLHIDGITSAQPPKIRLFLQFCFSTAININAVNIITDIRIIYLLTVLTAI